MGVLPRCGADGAARFGSAPTALKCVRRPAVVEPMLRLAPPSRLNGLVPDSLQTHSSAPARTGAWPHRIELMLREGEVLFIPACAGASSKAD